MVRGNTHNEKGTDRIAGNNLMPELDQSVRIGDERHEIDHFGPVVAQHIADRVLHPAVGQQYPEPGQIGGERYDPYGKGMDLLRYLVPAEDPDTDEYRFEEERHGRLNGQRGAEYVPNVP